MAASNLQGGLISAVESDFCDVYNTEVIPVSGYIVNFYHPLIDIEPQMFRSGPGTLEANIIFKEQKTETNVDTLNIQILYEIYTNG